MKTISITLHQRSTREGLSLVMFTLGYELQPQIHCARRAKIMTLLKSYQAQALTKEMSEMTNGTQENRSKRVLIDNNASALVSTF